MPLLVVVLAAVALGPALLPGYTLIGDQVFVPDQSLLPWMVGLGAGLPRSVPQDAVVAALTGPVPGWVWESVALVAALVLLGTGVARLLRGAGTATRCVAAVVAVWSPYVAERLLLGHWSLLLAVAALPWALAAADEVRRGMRGAGARWLLWLGLASLTPTGGLFVLAMSTPVLLWSSAAPRGRRALVVLAGAALQLPWVVPSVLHPAAVGAAGVDVFALRAEGPWGSVLTALGTGGVWNVDAVPGSRSTVLAPLATLVLLTLAVAGRRAVLEVLGRPVAITLAVASAVGLVVALTGAWEVTRPVTRWVVESVPGGGLVRDGQKLLAPWLVLLAVASALGARRVARAAARRWRDAGLRRVVLVAVILLPLLTLPDLAWGALGRLASVDYPDDWARARQVLASDPAPGDVVSLPWSDVPPVRVEPRPHRARPGAPRHAAHRRHRHLPRRTPRGRARGRAGRRPARGPDRRGGAHGCRPRPGAPGVGRRLGPRGGRLRSCRRAGGRVAGRGRYRPRPVPARPS